jgi:hypothetical protein
LSIENEEADAAGIAHPSASHAAAEAVIAIFFHGAMLELRGGNETG